MIWSYRKDLPAPHSYTMSWRQSQDLGIDYRDFEYFATLPAGLELMAIAGVWNNRNGIRCLFIDRAHNTFRRDVFGGGGRYIIDELEVNAKGIEVGQVFIHLNGIEEKTTRIREATKLLEDLSNEIDKIAKD